MVLSLLPSKLFSGNARGILIAVCSLAISISTISVACAQIDPFGVVLSSNSDFDGGLTSWTATSDGVVATDFIQVPGNLQLELNGRSAVWQHVQLQTANEFHILTADAVFFALNRNPAWAGIGISYYASDWAFIDQFEKQISTKNTLVPASTGLLIPCSLGVRVPANAAHCIIWVANDDPTCFIVADNVQLLNFFSGNAASKEPKLNTLPSLLRTDKGNNVRLSGMEFWEIFGFTDSATGKIGWTGAESAIAREISLKPGAVYNVSSTLQLPRLSGSTPANFGVDFYDANWKRISGSFVPYRISNVSQLVQLNNLQVPVNAAHSILWAWSSPLDVDGIDAQTGPLFFNVDEVISVAKVAASAKASK